MGGSKISKTQLDDCSPPVRVRVASPACGHCLLGRTRTRTCVSLWMLTKAVTSREGGGGTGALLSTEADCCTLAREPRARAITCCSLEEVKAYLSSCVVQSQQVLPPANVDAHCEGRTRSLEERKCGGGEWVGVGGGGGGAPPPPPNPNKRFSLAQQMQLGTV